MVFEMDITRAYVIYHAEMLIDFKISINLSDFSTGVSLSMQGLEYLDHLADKQTNSHLRFFTTVDLSKRRKKKRLH